MPKLTVFEAYFINYMYYLSSFSDEQDRHSFEGFNMPLLEDDVLQEQEHDLDNENNYDRETQRPIPPSFTKDEIFVPKGLPVPATSTPCSPCTKQERKTEENNKSGGAKVTSRSAATPQRGTHIAKGELETKKSGFERGK